MKRVCISGLGSIGLPLASLVASAGYLVRGVDTNPEVVEHLEHVGITCAEHNLSEMFQTVRQADQLSFAIVPAEAEIHIIAVPTALNRYNQPDLSCIDAAVEGILPFLRSHDLVIVESTCPIGKTDSIAKRVKETSPGVFVAYCPERVIPGNILFELISCNRIVGGVDKGSTEEARQFYQSFVKGEVHVTTAKIAEAVKLAENSFRDVNIAFANELSMILGEVGLDAREVIKQANRHPRVEILNPSAGVGGYCIPVNPWLLASSAPDHAPLLKTAREVNKKKTEWARRRIEELAKGGKIESIACLGLTYKENVPEIRESSALALATSLQGEFRVLPVDPYVPDTIPLANAIAQADLVVGLVAHDVFRNIPLNMLKGKEVLDFAGVFG